MGPPGGARRVVSLVPSVSETLRAWGVEPVGVTRFCEQPDLPTLGGTKDPDVAAIVELGPDLVVACREENRREDVEALRCAGVRVEVLQVESVADVAVELYRLADLLGVHVDPPLRGAIVERSAPAPATVTAIVPIWRKPWMVLGPSTYGADLLRSIGVTTVAPDDGSERYPTVEPAVMADLAADVVLAPSEPYPFGPRHLPELEAIAPTVLVDGQDLLWWGVRTPRARGALSARLDEVLAHGR